MKLLASQQIPGILQLFKDNFDIQQMHDAALQTTDLSHTDVLITRSTLPITQALLQGSSIKVVASPTSGIDHIDTACLDNRGIKWFNAPGCNANAVADYVLCSIAAIQQQGFLKGKKLRAGVIGVGHVGSAVVQRLEAVGFDVIENDPPRAEKERGFCHTPLTEFCDLDLICLHTPLTIDGKHPTFHLIDKLFLKKQKKGCILLNAGRGSVLKTDDLFTHGKHLQWCFDVYENEPHIDKRLLEQALIATPHIAGHSIQAKWRGTFAVYRAICCHFSLPFKTEDDFSFPENIIELSTWQEKALRVYNPLNDTKKLVAAQNIKEAFLKLRSGHNRLTEFNPPR